MIVKPFIPLFIVLFYGSPNLLTAQCHECGGVPPTAGQGWPVTGQLVALVISSPRTAGQLVAKTRRQNEKLISADHTKYQI